MLGAYVERVPDAGPAQEAAVRPADHRDLPARLADPRPGRQRRQRPRRASSGVDNGGVYNLINLFSGGALLQLTIFALGIMPYITASIILQLLVVVIPRLEALKKEGQAGQTKITQYTRYLTLGLARAPGDRHRGAGPLGQPASAAATRPLLYNDSTQTFLVMVITMTAGTAVIMWLGELITDRGIGNGMSILIFTQVVAALPGLAVVGRASPRAGGPSRVVIAIGLVIIAAVIFIEQAQRRIPVQYARRMVGRKMFGGSLDLHPAQGQPGRRHPGHLRVVAALPAGDGRRSSTRAATPAGRCGSRRTSSAATTRST